MISGKIFVCLVLLSTANYMLAEDSQEDGESPQEQSPTPDFGSLGLNDLLDAGQRDENDDSGPGDDDNAGGPQSRFFFSSFFNTRLVSCNYTTQAGASCPNCRQILRCFSGNAGTLVTCRGFFPYCNSGRCSLYPQTNCTSTG